MEHITNIQQRANTTYPDNPELARAHYLGALEAAYTAATTGTDPVGPDAHNPDPFKATQKRQQPTSLTITLTDYETANLKAAIEATGALGIVPPSPLTALHTGDWLGQVYNKLPPTQYQPNQTPQEIATTATNWRPAHPDQNQPGQSINPVGTAQTSSNINKH